MFNVETFVGDLHEYMKQAITPLVKRIEILEAEIAEREIVPDALDVAEEVVSNEGFYELIRLQVAEVAKQYPAKDGEQGPKGDPGFGLAGAMIDRAGHLVLTLSSGETKDVGVVVGDDGTDGAPGFALDDFTADYDGERGLVLKFDDGRRTKEFHLHLPIPIHRGFWSDGRQAKAGDAWTHAGSLWIAKRDTTTTPAFDRRDDWQLAARKGKDGEPGSPGGTEKHKTVKLNGA